MLYSTFVEGGNTNEQGFRTGKGGDTGENGGNTGETGGDQDNDEENPIDDNEITEYGRISPLK